MFFKAISATFGVIFALLMLTVGTAVISLVAFGFFAKYAVDEQMRELHIKPREVQAAPAEEAEPEIYDAKARAEYWEGRRREHFADVKLLQINKRQHALNPLEKQELEERVKRWPDVLKEIEREMEAHPDLKAIFERDWRKREEAKKKVA